MAAPRHLWSRVSAAALALMAQSCSTESFAPLPALNLNLRETTVSGISSGAFMAVQFGVAHSESVKGAATTAGGPYFCAGGEGMDTAVARCMQGDPMFPAQAITETDLERMVAGTRAWAKQGRIDEVSALARQQIWIFHGYNDGIVKRPVTDALEAYYRAFLPERQIFHKRDLPAGHAQISALCQIDGQNLCASCAETGGRFVNACADRPEQPENLYDPIASALQQFYGPLLPPAAAPPESLRSFDQRPYVLADGKPLPPKKISLADTGYLFLPKSCQEGAPCRLHIAFHGCQQYAGKIGSDFARASRLNGWAESNRVVVLYPQTTSSAFAPANPGGCWDWWGYNDASDDFPGHYATKDGAQIAAVWRMAEALAGSGKKQESPVSALVSKPEPRILDRSFDQALLAWPPVSGAQSYRVYRRQTDAPLQPRPISLSPRGFTGLAFADHGLAARTEYAYIVAAIDAKGREIRSDPVTLRTGAQPPACDPYFSMLKGHPVDRNNQRVNAVCP